MFQTTPTDTDIEIPTQPLVLHGFPQDLQERAAAAVRRAGYDFDTVLLRFLYQVSFGELEPFDIAQADISKSEPEEGAKAARALASDEIVVEDVADWELEQMQAYANHEGYTLDELAKSFMEHMASTPTKPFDFVRQRVLFD